MKLFLFFLVIIASIFVNVDGRSPIPKEIPHPVHAFAGVDACDQPKKIGTTTENNNYTRYYYNKDDKECQSFIFEGGPATKNNFETKEACEDRCMALLISSPAPATRGTRTTRFTTITSTASSRNRH